MGAGHDPASHQSLSGGGASEDGVSMRCARGVMREGASRGSGYRPQIGNTQTRVDGENVQLVKRFLISDGSWMTRRHTWRREVVTALP